MMRMQLRERKPLLRAMFVALLVVFGATSANAFQFSLGELEGSLDSTASFGMSWRMDDRDKAIIGTSNGGTAYSVNGDDGNLNYDRNDPISQTYKITSDLDLRYETFGVFLRGSAFYDHENYKNSRARTPLTDEAMDLVGKDAELLDAYAWWNFDIGEMPGQIRLGDQVLSWGESTFIQNSINTINPVNVNKFRLPGSELKEALVPVGMVSASLSPSDNLTFEGFYQYDWEKTEIDPPGTYWSTNDFAGAGGSKVMFGWGDVPDSIPPGTGGILGPPIAPIGPAVPRGATQYASDEGQFGLAMRLYVPQLNDSELGFYFINYHSRLPIISAQTGTLAGLGGGDYASTARYFTEYPEDIKLYGASFSTQLSSSGIALQGEYSYRQDMPLQVDDIELLMAALSPTDPYIAGKVLVPADLPNMQPEIALGSNTFSNSQLGAYEFDSTIHGYEEMDVSQAQMTMTKTFGPTFGANQFVMVGEVGATYVHDMPSKSELRFESAATYVSGNDTPVDIVVTPPGVTIPSGGPGLGAVAHPGKEIEDSSAFADDLSWGYRLVAKMDFNDAIGAVTLSPRVAWKHDVEGNSPGPGGNFLEHRKAVTFGVNADYQKRWSADLSYTDFFGAGRYNLANDRDVLALNVKYSF
ncbi:MAG: DUF1302 domain-containing protein [Desulfuromonadales bacterium]|nr:DUF1302 domain-containing protein [Desulfuromonadales bacterium]